MQSLPHRVVGRLREASALGLGSCKKPHKCQVLFCDGVKIPAPGDTDVSGLGLLRLSGGYVLTGSGQGSTSAQGHLEPGRRQDLCPP